ncbi:beta-lactamase hydrolase domain-containing protein [Serratia nevei]|uniref:beta-lactamase hydrolase domain-containing protein n=1 Tax=Serratia nevei TaxID=2703794 RepID=UPI003F7EAB6C
MRICIYHPQLSFSGAPEASDFKALSQQGYRLIVNNRPDEEPGEYLDHLQEKALAEQGGMRYVYLPYTFDTLTWETVYTFQFLLRQGKKTLAHCRSGARSACLSLLYALREGQIDEAQFRRQCDEYGADADKALSWYDKHRSVRATAEVHAFYEPESGSLQYVVADPEARRCAIIDPVLDFDRRSGTVSHQQAKDILNFIHQRGWGVAWVLDTHPHADHYNRRYCAAPVSAACRRSREKHAPCQIDEWRRCSLKELIY